MLLTIVLILYLFSKKETNIYII